MFLHQVACIEIILETGSRLFFNLFCTMLAEIQKVELGYEEMQQNVSFLFSETYNIMLIKKPPNLHSIESSLQGFCGRGMAGGLKHWILSLSPPPCKLSNTSQSLPLGDLCLESWMAALDRALQSECRIDS